MKILIVTSSDLNGGANKAAYRLHHALTSIGVNSLMLVQNKISDEYNVIGPTSNIRRYLINPLRPALDRVYMIRNRVKTLFSISCFPFSEVVRQINSINPDIVHLHWVAGGMITIEEIAKIRAPIIWSCQDMWPFTGGCHFSGSCKSYRDMCGRCPVLKSNKINDISRKVFSRKLKSYTKIQSLTVVGVSKWITECAEKSHLFSDVNIRNLPNCVNVDLFKPIDKNIAKDIFKIPKNRKIILFGAMNPTSDKRKGGAELFEAINLLELDPKTVVFVIGGSSKPEDLPSLKYPFHYISPLRDEVSLPLMYNIADVMVVPSLEENLSNTILESLSCGVPVVAFDIGGNRDLIEHKKNGFLADRESPESLARGISWILEHAGNSGLSSNAREKVLKEFESKVVARKYLELYEEVLNPAKQSKRHIS